MSRNKDAVQRYIDDPLIQTGKLVARTAIGVSNLATLAINPTLTLADLKPVSKGAKNFSPKWSTDQANNYLKQWRKLQLVTSDLT
jgi:glycerol kinase